MRFILVESIKPLNEGKKIGDDTYMFESAESLLEFLQNADEDIRILYDKNIDSYLVGSAMNITHLDLLSDAQYEIDYYAEYGVPHTDTVDTLLFIPGGTYRNDNYYYNEGYTDCIVTEIGDIYYREHIPSELYEMFKHKNLIVSEGEVEEVDESLITEVYPNKGESKDDFISRFMSVTKDEYPDQKQRYAVALSYWDRRNKSKKK